MARPRRVPASGAPCAASGPCRRSLDATKCSRRVCRDALGLGGPGAAGGSTRSNPQKRRGLALLRLKARSRHSGLVPLPLDSRLSAAPRLPSNQAKRGGPQHASLQSVRVKGSRVSARPRLSCALRACARGPRGSCAASSLRSARLRAPQPPPGPQPGASLPALASPAPACRRVSRGAGCGWGRRCGLRAS